MKQPPTHKRKNIKLTAWGKKRSVTLPEAMADFVIGEAERRGVPAYWLVNEAVEFYARAFPVKETTHDLA